MRLTKRGVRPVCARESVRRATIDLAFGVLASVLLACGGSSEPRVGRLVDTIPAERFRFGESLSEVFRWEFHADEDLAPWTIRADLEASRLEEGLRLRGSDRSSLVRSVDLSARDVDRIRVRMTGLRAGRTRVYWATDSGPFSSERQVTLRPSDVVDDVFEFRVGEHPDWVDRIRRIRIDASTFPGEEVQVLSIVGARTDTSAPDAALDPDRDWRIEVDGQLRSGFVVTSGETRTRRLAVPPGSRLHLATALLVEPAAGTATFAISHDADGRREALFSRTTNPSEPDRQRWVPSTVTLPPGVVGETDLEFTVTCPQAPDCAGAFASIEARSDAPSSRPNVILVSIDTLRADRMSLFGNENRTTRHIERWAERSGIVFERAIAPSPWTLPSHVSMLTGLNPTTHGVNHSHPAPPGLELLPERLRAAGYFTAAITGGGYVDPEFGFWQGFDVFDYWERDTTRYWDDQTASGEELRRGLSRATERLDEVARRPFFLFFHTYEVHGPFHAQQPFFGRFYETDIDVDEVSASSRRTSTGESDGYRVVRRLFRDTKGSGSIEATLADLPLIRALYDSGVAYTDREIGRLLGELESRGLLENSIVVLTSDHGEMLGELGLGGHAYLHDFNLRVPLILSWPAGLEGGRRVGTQVGTVDLVPTLLELLGDPSTDVLDGTSLVPLLEGRAADAREVISYAAASNRGLSVRLPAGLEYRYDNVPWRTGELESLVSLAPDGITAVPVDAPDHLRSLRRRIERLLESRGGLHMLLTNEHHDQPLFVRLQGQAVSRDRLKAIGLDCHCGQWLGRSTAEFRVPVGEQYGLQFEAPVSGVIRIEVRVDTDAYRTEIVLEDLDDLVTIRHEDARGWNERPAVGSTLDRGIAIWWQGDRLLDGSDALDDRLTQQLRALGYVQ